MPSYSGETLSMVNEGSASAVLCQEMSCMSMRPASGGFGVSDKPPPESDPASDVSAPAVPPSPALDVSAPAAPASPSFEVPVPAAPASDPAFDAFAPASPANDIPAPPAPLGLPADDAPEHATSEETTSTKNGPTRTCATRIAPL